MFSLLFTDDCKPQEFKCAADKKCILAYKLCDGQAQCKDNLDESLEAGCGKWFLYLT